MNASPIAVTLAGMSPDDLVGLAEIAKMVGRTKRTVRRWHDEREHGFPEPAARLSAGLVWRREDVERWAAEHLPLPTGRPPKPAN
jgi:prophage regulatory protein